MVQVRDLSKYQRFSGFLKTMLIISEVDGFKFCPNGVASS